MATSIVIPEPHRAGVRAPAAELDGRPRPHVKILERTAIVRFVDAEVLFEESAVRAIGDELARLIEEEGHTRLLLNFVDVKYFSGAMLGRLACLQRKLAPVRGRIQLCGLEPPLRDMLRITGLDRVFHVYTDEAEALTLGFSEERQIGARRLSIAQLVRHCAKDPPDHGPTNLKMMGGPKVGFRANGVNT